MGNCLCLDKTDKAGEKDMVINPLIETPQGAEYANNEDKMIEEIKEIYAAYLKGTESTIRQIRIINKEIDVAGARSLALIIPELTNLNEIILHNNSLNLKTFQTVFFDKIIEKKFVKI